jgi:hypothetical protein
MTWQLPEIKNNRNHILGNACIYSGSMAIHKFVSSMAINLCFSENDSAAGRFVGPIQREFIQY